MEPIAIVGSSCRFPGGASSPSKLWSLLQDPRDVLREIPSSRFNPEGFYHENGEYHGSTNVKHSYLLEEDHRLFDYSFFRMNPREAETMDPQQRILLETVYEGVDSAGYSVEKLRGSETAVFVGQMNRDYGYMLLRDLDTLPQYMATGADSSAIMSNRISYFFDWKGPSMTIDTACSSSLVALHLAVQSLRSGESQLAVAAGVNLLLGPEIYIAGSKLHMLSPSGRSRMWDSEVDGYGRGEGFAAVVLKPLSKAIADNDHIECVVRETGVNQDGRTKGITMPSVASQAALIRSTYAKCGLDLNKAEDRPQYFEAHGTGTPAGDPIEAEAIQRVFFPNQDDSSAAKLYVGSIKSIIGHLEGTAGLAGLLKASLAMKHATIPPNLHFKKLNPNVQPFAHHLVVPTELTPWPALTGVPRRASVNCFGFGGTNAHAIIEHWEPAKHPEQPECVSSHYGPFLLSADSSQSLVSAVVALSNKLKVDKNVNLADLGYTLARRSGFAYRASFSASTQEALIEKLDLAVHLSPSFAPATNLAGSAPVRTLGVFTGQGAQWPSMGAKLYTGSECFRTAIHRLEDSLAVLPDPPAWSLSQQLMAPAGTSRVHVGAISQPLCTAIQIALVDLLRSAGITFCAVVGHSSGEIAAAYTAGFLSAVDAVRIAYYRGVYASLAEGPQGQHGKMIAAAMSFEEATRLCEKPELVGRIVVAASNSASSVTLSGDADAIDEVKEILAEQDKFARVLKVDTAYHSHHMRPCAGPYLTSLQKLDIKIRDGPRSCIWFSSVSGSNEITFSDHDALKGQYWVDNMAQAVLFSQATHMAVTEQGYEAVLEVGPHPSLKAPTIETIKDLTGLDLPYSGVLARGGDDMEVFSDALGLIWKNFVSATPIVDFEGFRTACTGERDEYRPQVLKDLPAYSWDHDKVLWKESRKSKLFRTRSSPPHELLGTSTTNGQNRQEVRWRQILKLEELPWLRGHVFQGQVLFPAAGYIAMAFEASVRLVEEEQALQMVELRDLIIHRAITLDENSAGTEVTFIIRVTDRTPEQIVAEYSCYSGEADTSGQDSEFNNFTGRVVLTLGEPSPDALPRRVEPVLPMKAVEVDHFYSHLEELDLHYSGDFLVRSIQRRLNQATVTVKRLAHSKLRVHPATLDATFHGVFAAFSWPGDGRMWTTYLPTRIEHVRINMACPRSEQHADVGLIADCSVAAGDTKTVRGDISIFCAADGHPEIQIHGLTCSSFSSPGPQDDRKLFAKNVWMRDIAHGVEPGRKAPMTADDIQFVDILQRAAYFYCRKFRDEISPLEVPSMTWNYKHLTDWICNHVIPRIEGGDHPFVKAEWGSDTEDMVHKWKDDHVGQIDLELIVAVGEALPSIVRGKLPALQVLMENEMLPRLYQTSFGMEQANQEIAAAAAQITHRYPRMSILEIGAGTGGSTHGVLEAISAQFHSYTYTDISVGFFEDAQSRFREHANRMIFKALDIERDCVAQGFKEHSYDLVIAANVLHATKFLEETLRNCRQLLKPGGHLLLLEVTADLLHPQFIMGTLPGWFLGIDDGRVWAPTVDKPEWDSLLRKAGYSGVDTSSMAYVSVMVSQAVDDRVMILREPLAMIDRVPSIDNLLVVGGKSQALAPVASDIQNLLSPMAKRLVLIEAIEDIQPHDLDVYGAAVVCISDLDSPTFQNMDEKRFQGLQSIFRNAKYILWVTRGCLVDNPDAAMIVGMGRSLLTEIPGLRLQFLDIGTHDAPSPALFAESLMRLCCLALPDYQDVLWSTEHEIAFEAGVAHIPRILRHGVLNDRLNSTRRDIIEDVDFKKTSVEIVRHQGHMTLREHELPKELTTSPHIVQYVSVKVTSSSVYPFTTTDGRSIFFSIGSIVGSDQDVLAISQANSSLLRVSADDVFPWEQTQNDPARLQLLLSTLVVKSILDATNGILWVHQPSDGFAKLISDAAKERGCEVFFTTSVSSPGSDFQFIHPRINPHDLERIKPRSVDAFVNLQLPVDLSLDSLIRSSLASSTAIRDVFADVKGKMTVALSYSASTLLQIISLWDVPKMSPIRDEDIVPLGGITVHSETWQPTAVLDWRTADTVPLKLCPVSHSGLFSPQKTYLLVGLTGDLGISICKWMIENGARHLVITSRNPKVAPEVVKELERHGAKLRIVPLDVADKCALTKVYHDICDTMPPIGGVANAAMVLRDKTFETMTWEDMDAVIQPKVQGSKNLDELFYSADLEFFILFSSVALIVGNSGQSNYGAANMFMTSLAYQRRKRGVAASVIHLSMLLGVGYVSRFGAEFQGQLRKKGITAISETDVHDILAEAIVAGRPESTQDPEIITGVEGSLNAAWAVNPRSSHCLNEDAALSDESKSHRQANVDVRSKIAEAGDDDEALDILEASLCRVLANSLQLDADKIDRTSSLTNLSIDSLVAVQIRSWFHKELDMDVPVLKILSDISIVDLCKDAFSKLPNLGESNGVKDVAAPDSRDVEGPASTIEWDKEISSLSERLPPVATAKDHRTNGTGEKTAGLSVVLTGATGFLGTHVLRALVADARVSKVHCIAIRKDGDNNARSVGVQSPKIMEYPGNLTDDLLGMSEADYHMLETTADVIIHNGAEVNFLKSYYALKQVNVIATAKIVELAVSRSIPVHFVSSATVALFADGYQLPEISVRNLVPPGDGFLGYASSKWVCEVFLENAAASHHMPIFIHRASAILGDGAPDTDLMTVVDRYSRLLLAVPRMERYVGEVDTVEVGEVSDGIVATALGSSKEAGSAFLVQHYCNKATAKTSDLRQYYEEMTGSQFSEWPSDVWLDKALELGLDARVEFYFRESARSGELVPVASLRRGVK